MTTGEDEPTIQDSVSALEAHIAALEEGPEIGLARLANRTDPEAISHRLAILIDAKRFGESADLVRGKEPHEKWAHSAIGALVLNGELQEARRILSWAKGLPDPITRRRCALAYAERVLRQITKGHEDDILLVSSPVEAEKQSQLREITEILLPVVLTAQGQEAVETELDSVALTRVLIAHHMLGEYERVQGIARLLMQRRPVPFLLAQLASKEIIKCPPDLPARLRAEHPDSFDAKLMAALLEGQFLGKHNEGFDSAERLVGEATSSEQKRQICQALNQIAQSLSGPVRARADGIARNLLDKDDPLLRLFRAHALLRKGDMQEAGALLESLHAEEDAYWQQLSAQYWANKGDWQKALEHELRASKISPYAAILETASEIAVRAQHWDEAVKCLQQVTQRNPNNIDAWRRQASLHVFLRAFSGAAADFEHLQGLEPTEESHALNRALNLRHANRLRESLDVLESICAENPLSQNALLLRAEVLRNLQRPEDAFRSLQNVREAHWNSPVFLPVYMKLAYAAGDDAAGQDALNHILELQDTGKISEILLQNESIDDILLLIQEEQERKKTILETVIGGKCPWLWAGKVLGNQFYWAWRRRTQDLTWINDDLIVRAEFSIYATNGFRVLASGDQPKRLESLECSEAGKPIVMDLTAMLTAHRLGILNRMADYFGEIRYPAVYTGLFVESQANLMPHQLSQEVSFRAIHNALNAGRIMVLSNPAKEGDANFPIVDEYSGGNGDSEQTCGFRDLAQALYEGGRISQSENARLLQVAHKPSSNEATLTRFESSEAIRVAVSSLQTIHAIGLFDAVVNAFNVHITDGEAKEISREISAVAFRDETLKWQDELWNVLHSDLRFKQVPHAPHPGLADTTSENPLDPYIAASLLAQQQKIPLLADDRVLQMLVHSNSETGPCSAFSTNHTLAAMGEAGLLDAVEMARCYLKLLEWRYRFVVPPDSVLKTFADSYPDYPPGQDLRQASLYVHDCMRDRGLFGGLEPTEPPSSMAVQLFLRWVWVITQFLTKVWEDVDYSEEKAEKMTRWAVREFLPSPPLSDVPHGFIAGNNCSRVTLAYALVHTALSESRDRTNRFLTTLADALGISGEDYLREVANAINTV